MNAKQKAERTGIIFLVLLIVSGAVLLYRGNDAVALGVAKKEGILTAEQVKMSFDSVSGRLLHQHPEGITPSTLAAKVGVARATLSTMLQRLERSGEVRVEARSEDGRGKLVRLTSQGRAFMQEVLPPHHLRVSRLMEKLTQQEQEELIRLLRKLAGE